MALHCNRELAPRAISACARFAPRACAFRVPAGRQHPRASTPPALSLALSDPAGATCAATGHCTCSAARPGFQHAPSTHTPVPHPLHTASPTCAGARVMSRPAASRRVAVAVRAVQAPLKPAAAQVGKATPKSLGFTMPGERPPSALSAARAAAATPPACVLLVILGLSSAARSQPRTAGQHQAILTTCLD